MGCGKVSRILLLAGTLSILSPCNGISKPKKKKNVWHSAVVKSVNADQGKIVLITKRFKNGVELRLGPRTVVEVGEKRGNLTSLKAGQSIKCLIGRKKFVRRIVIDDSPVAGETAAEVPHRGDGKITPGVWGREGAYQVAFSPDGGTLAVTHDRQKVVLYDLASKAAL